MNNYKERYDLLEKEISVLEKDKQILEKSLKVRETNLEDEEKKTNDLQIQLFKLECEKDRILNSKSKLINILIDSLKIIASAGILALAIILFETISASTLLTIPGLTYGGVVLLGLELTIIKAIEHSLKRKHVNRIKNEKEYLQLIEKTNNKQQELNYAKTAKKQIKKEMNKITSNIDEQKEILSSKKGELLNLFQEILSETLQVPLTAETMLPFQEPRAISSVKKRVKVQDKNTK